MDVVTLLCSIGLRRTFSHGFSIEGGKCINVLLILLWPQVSNGSANSLYHARKFPASLPLHHLDDVIPWQNQIIGVDSTSNVSATDADVPAFAGGVAFALPLYVASVPAARRRTNLRLRA